MHYLSRIFSIVFAALSLGATNPAAADSDSYHRGMGPGMMGGGMMGGMGPGYGPGYGMGQGMMGGYHQGYGPGSGMMGMSAFRGLNLTSDQKSKISRIQKTARTKHWTLMDQMMDANDHLQELYDAEKQDASAINSQYKIVEDLRRQMVENSVDAHNQINAVLTKDQRDKLQQSRPSPGMRGY